MANEWVVDELYGANNDGEKVNFTIADGTSVSQGQLLNLADDRTVVVSAFDGPVAGVAAEEHLASVGVTNIAVWTNGRFRATSSGSIAIGQYLTAGGASLNTVTASSAVLDHTQDYATSHNQIRALDAVTDATALTVRLLC